MFQDYILNGDAKGSVGETIAGVKYSPELMRPFIDEKGKRCVTYNTGEFEKNEEGLNVPKYEKREIRDLQNEGINSPVFNATTTLRKDDWIRMDAAVQKETRARLKAWNDLSAAASITIPGMATPMFEHENMDDGNIDASVDMDGRSSSNTDDTPKFQLEGLPMPITHYGFEYATRKLAVSRNSGTPLDTLMAERAGRKVAESVEKTVVGTLAGLTYKTAAGQGYSLAPTVYGYTTHPSRNTKTDLTTPTGSNPNSTVNDVLTMRSTLYSDGFYGPYDLYFSTDWSVFMDNDYAQINGTNWANNPTQTLKERLQKIDGVNSVKRLDFLTDTFTLILVQRTSDVARAVIGMQPTLLQWPSVDQMSIQFKVMAILTPQVFATQSGNCGIVHGTTS